MESVEKSLKHSLKELQMNIFFFFFLSIKIAATFKTEISFLINKNSIRFFLFFFLGIPISWIKAR